MKQQDFGDLKRMNSIWLCILIFAICLPAAMLGVRALLPVWLQNDFFDFMSRHTVVANLMTYSFYVVGVLGLQLSAIAIVMFAVNLFLKGVPVWLKAVTAVWILTAIYGTLAVRHALGR